MCQVFVSGRWPNYHPLFTPRGTYGNTIKDVASVLHTRDELLGRSVPG